MPARKQIESQHSLTKHLSEKGAHKTHFTMCWPNTSNASEDKMYQKVCYLIPSDAKKITKCISTREDKMNLNLFEQTPRMPVRTQNAHQHVMNKHISCQRGYKLHLNMCWPISSRANEDSKCISTCADQTHPCQRRPKLYLNMCWPKLSHTSEDT